VGEMGWLHGWIEADEGLETVPLGHQSTATEQDVVDHPAGQNLPADYPTWGCMWCVMWPGDTAMFHMCCRIMVLCFLQ
jgi:hypothetical protein